MNAFVFFIHQTQQGASARVGRTKGFGPSSPQPGSVRSDQHGRVDRGRMFSMSKERSAARIQIFDRFIGDRLFTPFMQNDCQPLVKDQKHGGIFINAIDSDLFSPLHLLCNPLVRF